MDWTPLNDHDGPVSRPGGRVERRHELIALAMRRARAGSGSGIATLARRTTRLIWPDLRRALGEVPWAVCGAVATRLYMPERATADLDILIHSGDGTSAQSQLAAHGFLRQGDL